MNFPLNPGDLVPAPRASSGTGRRWQFFPRWQRRVEDWRFGQKMALGYALAIATGVVGSLAGIGIADHFQGRSIVQLHEANTQVRLLGDLRSTLQAARLAIDEGSDQELTSAQRQVFRQEAITAIQRADDLTKELAIYLNQQPKWLADPPDRLLWLANHSMMQLRHYAAHQLGLTDAASEPVHLDRAEAEDLEWRSLAQVDRDLAQLLVTAHNQAGQAEELLEEAQGIEKGIIIGSLLVSAAIAVAISVRLTQKIVNPLVRAAAVAQRAAETGDFSQRVGLTTGDEVGLLARSLDTLIARVAERNQELEDSADLARAQAKTLYATLTDLRRTQAQLVQTEKMSLLGQVAAGVAHEINNPTSFIYGNLIHIAEGLNQLLELLALYEAGQSPSSPEIRELVERLDLDFLRDDLPRLLTSMRAGAERIRAIVLSLRLFARLDEAEVKAIDLHQSIDSVLTILGSRLCAQAGRPAIALTLDYGPLPAMECYAGQLNQVLMHLLTNAIDAIEDGVRQQPDRPLELRIATELCDRDWVTITIADTGMGMPPEVQQRVFDLFYTTKPIGKGSGMGLAIAHQVITEKHGGTIDCESSERGTTFTLKLPVRLSIATPPKATAGVDRDGQAPIEPLAGDG